MFSSLFDLLIGISGVSGAIGSISIAVLVFAMERMWNKFHQVYAWLSMITAVASLLLIISAGVSGFMGYLVAIEAIGIDQARISADASAGLFAAGILLTVLQLVLTGVFVVVARG